MFVIRQIRDLAKHRTVLRVVVWLIVAVILIYFLSAVQKHWSSIADWRPDWTGWVTVIAAMVFYGINLILLAELWHRLINGCQDIPFSRVITYTSYSKTQIAKYLPGNVFQFVGRHIFMTSRGASQRRLAFASVLEIVTLIGSASFLIVLGFVLGFLPQVEPLFDLLDIRWSVIAVVGGIVVVALVLPARVRALPKLPSARVLLIGFGLAIVFFLFLGLILVMLVTIVSGHATASMITAAILAWLVGYMTPGAPGGIGVRELVMLFLLRTDIPEADALIAIGLFRLATSIGDFIFFIVGEITWGRHITSEPTTA